MPFLTHVPSDAEGSQREEWRVGKLAHDPLRSRCPRAAPNPFFRDYAPDLSASMGQQSHETGYEGSSTVRLLRASSWDFVRN
jgi:hypothetical protein